MSSATEPVVSDHALVRWLERVHGIDLSAFRDEIAATVASAINNGATGLVRDGVTYVVKGATVVTIVPGRITPISQQAKACRRRIAFEAAER